MYIFSQININLMGSSYICLFCSDVVTELVGYNSNIVYKKRLQFLFLLPPTKTSVGQARRALRSAALFHEKAKRGPPKALRFE